MSWGLSPGHVWGTVPSAAFAGGGRCAVLALQFVPMRFFRRKSDEEPQPPDDTEEDEAPGWYAIEAALAVLYPGVEPHHVSPGAGPGLGGGVQGISAYPAEGHWHLVTFGPSELYEKETADSDVSGYGYELTLRVVRPALGTPSAPGDPGYELVLSDPATGRSQRRPSSGAFPSDPPPDWAFVLLEQVALTVHRGSDYAAGHRLDPGGPIDGGSSTLTALAFTVDPELGTIATPNGAVTFLQLVGITAAELREMQETTTEDVLARLARDNTLLITDVERGG
jgi:hypothetical protein